jgi:hypothetical protein
MKKLILVAGGFLALNVGALLLSSSTSATQSVITVKPALPKVVITKGFHSYYNIQDEVVEHIRANTKQGYVVKSVAMTEGGSKGWQRAVVVMEKY